MTLTDDWKKIFGLFPVTQQFLGLSEIYQGVCQTAGVIVKIAAVVLKNLFEAFSSNSSQNIISNNFSKSSSLSITEKLESSIKKIAIGVLYFTPLVGTVYSGVQLCVKAYGGHTMKAKVNNKYITNFLNDNAKDALYINRLLRTEDFKENAKKLIENFNNNSATEPPEKILWLKKQICELNEFYAKAFAESGEGPQADNESISYCIPAILIAGAQVNSPLNYSAFCNWIFNQFNNSLNISNDEARYFIAKFDGPMRFLLDILPDS